MTPHQSPRTQVIKSVVILVPSLQNQMLAAKGDVSSQGGCQHLWLLPSPESAFHICQKDVILDVQTLTPHAESDLLIPRKVY